MEWIDLLIAGSVGLATSYSLITLILYATRRYGVPDRTIEAHHTHKIPIPRFGGVALAGSLAVVFLLFSFLLGKDFWVQSQRGLIVVLTLAMFFVGLYDDLFVLGAKRKLFGQLVIASLAYIYGIGIHEFKIPITYKVIELGLWSGPVTVIWLVAMTNLINLIDGIDGLAGGICLMLMSLFLYVSMQSGIVPIISAGLVGALLAFLRFNFPPAKIYMGDGGAYMLGFFIGCTTIVTSQKGTIVAALVAPLFVLALPIIDTSLAIIRRGLKGLPLFRADKRHIHHRLLAAGHSRRQVVLGLYLFTAFFLVLGFSTFFWHGQYFPLFLGIATLTVVMLAGKFSFSREWFSVGRVLGNSLEARADIQYAMSLSRWLALEGARAPNLEKLGEDVVFIARKLGFVSVRIRLEDDEKTWNLADLSPQDCGYHRLKLPQHKYCFLELGTTREMDLWPVEARITSNSAPDILADLVAEGWGKAMKDWKARTKLPVRFDARRPIASGEVHNIPKFTVPSGEFLTKIEPIEPDK
jgi:UDP-GlcNAc:undecaprenyl-phosphate GlcNAc-1-phosphate transferase